MSFSRRAQDILLEDLDVVAIHQDSIVQPPPARCRGRVQLYRDDLELVLVGVPGSSTKYWV
eukprot:14186648-Heterocapsa_arctica.AAC.1